MRGWRNWQTRQIGMVVMLLASSAMAAPPRLIAEVDYDFVDQNGFGWARVSGRVTVTLTLSGKDGSLAIHGKRRWVNGQLTAGKSPGAAPEMKANKWEGDVDETYPLHGVASTAHATSFALDPFHDHLTGSCAPTKATEVASDTLYECSIIGFQWHTIANLPELHHAIVFEATLRAKAGILNTMTGASKAGYGRRTVSEPKPPPRP